MEINWKNYRRVESFSLLDAAFLWLEIKPTPEMHSSLPLYVSATMKAIAKELDLSEYELFLGVAHKFMQEDEISEVEAIKRVLQPPLRVKGFEEETLKPVQVDVRLDPNVDPVWQMRWELRKHFSRHRKSEGDVEVSRIDLKELAKKWGETPKFLFPEATKGSSQTTTTDLNIENKFLSTKERNSYLKLIKGLLLKQGMKPGERGIAKSLEGMVKDAHQSLGDDKIRNILKEVQNLDED